MLNKRLRTALAGMLAAAAVIIFLYAFSTDDSQTNMNIVINEVLTENTNSFLGKSAQHYSWIELKNIGSEPVDLKGCFLSDNPKSLNKWELPSKVISPGEILLIYASGEDYSDEEEIHAGFELKNTVQTIVLSNSTKILSRMTIPKLDENISYGRNNEGTYVYFLSSTPGSANSKVFFSSLTEIGGSAAVNCPVRINELSSGKQNSVYDEHGHFHDFIELYNSGDEDIDLTGFFLCDTDKLSAKFRLNEVTVKAKGYLLIFASGESSSDSGTVHVPFKISSNETIRLYTPEGLLADVVLVPASAENVSYGRGLEDTEKWYFYSTPTPGYANITAPSETNSDASQTNGSVIVINEVLSSNSRYAPDAYGNYEDFIELYNQSVRDVDMSGWFLSDSDSDYKKWSFPEGTVIKPNEYMLIYASGRNTKDKNGKLHTSFKLDKSNEKVILSYGDTIVSTISYGKMKNNISAGPKTHSSRQILYFTSATPGADNASAGYKGFTSPVTIDQKSGIYKSKITVTLSCVQPNAKIYYTTDGSTPNENSKLYTSPITVSSGCPVRAVSKSSGNIDSDVVTANYLFNADHHGLPVIFLTTDHDRIFGGGGIYYAPLGSTRRVTANIELLEADGTGFNETVLVRKHGNMSSFDPQKSFAVYFRESAGKSSLEYDLFPGDPDGVKTFKSFLLRTSGNDWDDLKCKDAFIAMLARQEMDLDYQSYRPAVLYINGKYWGIYNIRDQQNEDYLASHHGINPDKVDIISFGHGVHEGSYTEYNKLINFVTSKDLNKESNWQQLESMMDVNNMIDTYLCHIYYGNFDTVNIKWWREKKEGAKWRWLLYDLD